MGIAADNAGAGRVTVRGDAVQFRELDGRAYVRAPAGAYDAFAPAAAGAELAGRWVRLPRRGGGAASELRDLSSLESLLNAALTAHGAVYDAGEDDIDGRPAIRLRDARGGSLYVASAGTPYPLAIESAKGGSRLDLEDWDGRVRVAAPRSFVNLEGGGSR
ncbi:MAG TPA: hypothetical protein VMA83_05755 [Solirubrobacteraceae bacterium]|nr:hypothetical protein [Solirubrobacteraceae bacterium]